MNLAFDHGPFPHIRLKDEAGLAIAPLAFDRDSVRQYDKDNRMHVKIANISKATVNPYWGREIPNFEELGLDPDRKYQLYRAPEELSQPETIASFNRLPVLIKHKPTSAEDHPADLTVGTTGESCQYNHPYLQNSLALWPKGAIDAVDSGKQRELSSSYHYDADMTPGVSKDGQKYDGVMRNIRGNHVALVEEGRAGPDVMIGDSKLEDNLMPEVITNPRRGVLLGSLYTYLQPRLAKDAKFDYSKLPLDKADDFKTGRTAIEAAVKESVKGKLAQDANIDDLAQLLNALSDGNGQDAGPMMTAPNSAVPPALQQKQPMDAEPDDTVAKIKEFLKGHVPPEVLAQLDAFLAEGGQQQPAPEGAEPGGAAAEGGDNKTAIDEEDDDKKDDGSAKDKAKDGVIPETQEGLVVTKDAMDEAIKVAVDSAIKGERDNAHAIRAAERYVRPWVGDLAMDAKSPDDVYRSALIGTGMPKEAVHKLHADALKPILDSRPKPGQRRNATTPALAADALPNGVPSISDMIPGFDRITVQG